MAIKYFAVNDQSNEVSGFPVFEYSETLSTPGAGNTIIAPDNVGDFDSIICGLVITSGVGRVEYSLSSRSSIIAGSGVWRAWDSGNVSASTDDVLEPAQAIRAVNVSGTIKLEAILV